MIKRFILLASARTGSSLVTAALHSHPAVMMYAEIFTGNENVRRAALSYNTKEPYAPDDYYRDGADPVLFLKQHVYGRAYAPEKKAVGFKLFHAHMRSGPGARLWDWLAGARDVHIIHLYRRRILEEYISLQIATITREWLVPASAGPHAAEVAPLTVDVNQFKQFADQKLRDIERAETLLRDRPSLTIEYQDDVCAKFDDTVGKLEAFLGIQPVPLPQSLQKQARLPLSEEIANFHEIHDSLAGTPYEACL